MTPPTEPQLAPGGVRPAAAPRRRAARAARPRLPGSLRSLDGDPAAAVPGVGADRAGAVGPRAHRDPLPHRLPRLRDAARIARGDRLRGSSSSGRSCAASGSRCTRRFHGKHTKRWAIEHDIDLAESDDPVDRQLAVDRRLLEEPRMEAHGVREFAPESARGRFVRRALQAAVIDVILPAFAEQVVELATAGRPLTRDLAARATVYLQARTALRDRRPRRPRRAARAVASRARRPRPPRARRPVRQGRVDPRRRARAARRRGPRVPANRRRARRTAQPGWWPPTGRAR